MLQSVYCMELLITSIVLHPGIPLSVAIAILLVYVLYLDHKVVVLTRGQSGASLEDVLRKCLASVEKIEEKNKYIIYHAATLDDKISHAIRNAQTIRYKAFDTTGSNQSFSIALVNEKGNGVVISSLHTYDSMRTFAKPIQSYESTYELTEEERAVLDDAKREHVTTKNLSDSSFVSDDR